jgi:uncharacterized SAM-binding protein YcdF (DUF218 family)
MFFTAAKIVGFVLTPSHFALIISAIGVSLINSRFWKWGGRLAIGGVALLVLLATGAPGHLLAVPLETRFPAPALDKLAAPAGIVVLGGGIDEKLSGEIGRVVFNDAAERLTAPLVLMRHFPNARLVYTGGSGWLLRGSPFSEAAAAKRFWRQLGVDDANVIYEDRSRTTGENATFTRDLVKPKPGERWLLVTSAMHMPRSVGIFRRAGFNVVPYPVDFRTSGKLWDFGIPESTAASFRLVDSAAHEWVGLVAYWATGQSDALLPAP